MSALAFDELTYDAHGQRTPHPVALTMDAFPPSGQLPRIPDYALQRVNADHARKVFGKDEGGWARLFPAFATEEQSEKYLTPAQRARRGEIIMRAYDDLSPADFAKYFPGVSVPNLAMDAALRRQATKWERTLRQTTILKKLILDTDTETAAQYIYDMSGSRRSLLAMDSKPEEDHELWLE